MMQVSIIIPVYNAEKTIKRCLDSIVEQTSHEWEVIAIDDGSTDKSSLVIEEYVHKYPKKIKQFVQKNSGVTRTRERGIREATGKYIMFVDNDDYLDKDYVETFLKEIESGDYDCVVGGYRRIDDNKKILFQYSPVSEWMQYSILTPWARILKKEAILKYDIHFLDYAIGEDIYFNMNFFYKTKKIKRINYVGYNWYYNTISVSNTTHKGLKKVYDPLYLLDEVDLAIEGCRDKLYQLWYVKWVVWHLCFSGRDANKKDFLNETDRMFEWLEKKNVKCTFPIFSKDVKGEPLKNRVIVVTFLMLRKLHLLNVFASMYCKGSIA